jgi:hypothetical protein
VAYSTFVKQQSPGKMVSVTRDNVKDLLSEIEADIRNAVFVGKAVNLFFLHKVPDYFPEGR